VEQTDRVDSSGGSGGVTVKVMHTSTASTGNLCTSLHPGEAFRSMRIIAVPFTKADLPPSPSPLHAEATGDSGGGGGGGYNGLSSMVQEAEPGGLDQTTFAEQLAAGRPAAPPGVPVSGYGGRGIPVVSPSSPGPGVWPQIGFNKHRRIMSRWKLPRDPHTGEVKGAMVASWAWIGWSGDQDEPHQLWHVQAVKNTSVEYYWLDAG
jgi:hypothetical protein